MSRSIALAAAVLACSTIVGGCGGDDEQSTPDPGSDTPEFSLVVTREDGSTLEFDDYTVTCEPRYYDGASPSGDIVEVRSQPDPTRRNFRSYFFVHAVVADVEDGASFEFGREISFVYDDPSGVDFVIHDGRSEEPFVASGELSSGTLTVRSATCSPEPAIELELNGTLENEYDTVPSIEVVGSMDVSG